MRSAKPLQEAQPAHFLGASTQTLTQTMEKLPIHIGGLYTTSHETKFPINQPASCHQKFQVPK